MQPIPLDQTGGRGKAQQQKEEEEEPKRLKFVERLEEERQPEADINIRVSQTYDSEEEGEGEAALVVELIDENDDVIRLKKANETLKELVSELEEKIPIPLDESEERRDIVPDERPIKFVEREPEPDIGIRVSQTHDSESETA